MEIKKDKTMEKLVTQLKKKPMFRFSMSSLELFHSNFLEWLFDLNEKAFLKCFGIVADPKKEYKIIREHSLGETEIDGKNKKWVTDIAVFAKDKNKEVKGNGELVLIIENKIKSLPSKGQLESQSRLARENCKKILLTLFDLPDEYTLGFENDPNPFVHKKYSEIVGEIKKQDYAGNKTYIKDYCNMVELLQSIIQKMNIPKDEFVFHQDYKPLFDCSMQDAFRKYQAAQLVHHVYEKIIKNQDYKGITIKSGAWLNHKRACVDIFLELDKELLAGVQIEHDQFRVAFTGKIIEKLFDEKDLSKEAFEFFKQKWSDDWLRKYDGNKDYCKYGNSFIYRYVKIPTDKTISIEDLLTNGGWYEENNELSVDFILKKIIAEKDSLIDKLCKIGNK